MNALLIFGWRSFPFSLIITDGRAYEGGIVRLHIYDTMFRLKPLGEPIISMKRAIDKMMRNAYSIEAYRNSAV